MKTLAVITKVWTQGVIEILLFFPFYIVISHFILPVEGLALWALHLTLYYGAGFAVYQLLPLKRYLIYPVLMMIVAGLAYLFNGLSIAGAVSLLVGSFLCFRGTKSYFTPWHQQFHTKYYWIGLVFYFIASGLFAVIEAMEPYRTLVFWLGALSLATTLLVSNQKILKKETLSGKHSDPKVASAIAWQNRILIGISLLIILFVGMIGKLRDGFAWLISQINTWYQQITAVKEDLSGSSDRETSGSGGSFGEGAGTNVDPSTFALSLQNIVFYIVFILIGIVALVLLFFLGKLAINGVKKLIAWLGGNLNDSKTRQIVGEAYEDKRESLFNLKNLRNQMANRMKDWLTGMLEREPKWSDMQNNIERVRYLYRNVMLRYMDKGYNYRSSNTPLETSKDITTWDQKKQYPIEVIVDYYNQARYNGDELMDAKRKLEEIKDRLEGAR